MADGLNRACLLGNLGQDPDLKFTQGGQAVLKLSLATTESYLDRSGQRHQRTDWHRIVVWGKRGEGLSKILLKGARIYIEGSIQTRSWDDKNTGEKRYATEIVASQVVLCGSAPGRSSGASGQGQRSDAGYQTNDAGGYGGPQGADDDIPF